jgi:hypothetical protein
MVVSARMWFVSVDMHMSPAVVMFMGMIVDLGSGGPRESPSADRQQQDAHSEFRPSRPRLNIDKTPQPQSDRPDHDNAQTVPYPPHRSGPSGPTWVLNCQRGESREVISP